jgi:hypothetical protein
VFPQLRSIFLPFLEPFSLVSSQRTQILERLDGTRSGKNNGTQVLVGRVKEGLEEVGDHLEEVLFVVIELNLMIVRVARARLVRRT